MINNDEELLELEEFYSDDGKHHIIWADGGQGYEVWWCDTHNRNYYKECAKEN